MPRTANTSRVILNFGVHLCKMRTPTLAVPAPEKGVLVRLLSEVIPHRRKARAATVGSFGTLDAPEAERRAHGLNYLYCVAEGRIARPPADDAWWLGQAAAAVSRQRWCSPALFLFACGHFAEFAVVLLKADEKQLRRDRKRELIQHLPSALDPDPPRATRDELIRRHRDAGLDELSASRAQTYEAHMLRTPRVDRAVWSLSGSENEALRAAWMASRTQPMDLAHPGIAACHLAASGRVPNAGSGANIPFPTRVLIAKEALLAALRAL